MSYNTYRGHAFQRAWQGKATRNWVFKLLNKLSKKDGGKSHDEGGDHEESLSLFSLG